MSYRIILSPEAVATLETLDGATLDAVEQRLVSLGESPASLSRPSTFPWPPGRQIYEFDVDLGREAWDHFNVQFRYGQDEETLQILVIGRVTYPREAREDGPDSF